MCKVFFWKTLCSEKASETIIPLCFCAVRDWFVLLLIIQLLSFNSNMNSCKGRTCTNLRKQPSDLRHSLEGESDETPPVHSYPGKHHMHLSSAGSHGTVSSQGPLPPTGPLSETDPRKTIRRGIEKKKCCKQELGVGHLLAWVIASKTGHLVRTFRQAWLTVS